MNKDVHAVIQRYPSIASKLYIFLRYLLLPPQRIESYFPKKGVIIDLGCGHGLYTLYMGLRSKRRRLLGYDLNAARIASASRAAKGLRNVQFFKRDLTKDSHIKTCDCVSLIDIIHHIPPEAQDAVLRESHRKLRKGGLLLIKDLDNRPRWKYYYNYLHDKIMTRNDPLFFVPARVMKTRLESLGFRVTLLKTIHVGALNPIPHYILLAKK